MVPGLQKGWDGGIIGWEGDGKAWKRMIRMEKKESMGRGRKGWEKNEKTGKRTERPGRGRKGWEEDGKAGKRMERLGRG